MNSSEVPVILKDLPTTVKGFCCIGEDYLPCIVLNSRLSFEQQQEAYIHEYMHIKTGQIYDDNYVEYGT